MEQVKVWLEKYTSIKSLIVGRLIPAGTGYREYVDQDITVPDQKERPDRFLDELSGNPIIADLD